MNSVHIFTPTFFKISSNVILPFISLFLQSAVWISQPIVARLWAEISRNRGLVILVSKTSRPDLSPVQPPMKGKISPESKTAGSSSSADIKNVRNYTSKCLHFAVLNYAEGNISSCLQVSIQNSAWIFTSFYASWSNNDATNTNISLLSLK
jgi:hypothetical protein